MNAAEDPVAVKLLLLSEKEIDFAWKKSFWLSRPQPSTDVTKTISVAPVHSFFANP